MGYCDDRCRRCCRNDGKRLEREKSFLSRPVNLLALLAAVVTFVLGLVWRMTGTGPLQ